MSHTQKNHTIPILFLLLLLSICIFIVGLQYGRTIANTDAAIAYIKKHLPTPVPTKATPSITYLTLKNEDCGVELTYPSYLSPAGSKEGQSLLHGNNQMIEIYCNGNLDLPAHTATAEVEFKEATISAIKGKFNTNYPDEQFLFTIIHPQTKKKVTIIVSPALFELVNTSLTFIETP